MRLDELRDRMADRITFERRSFLLRVEPKTGDHERFVEYTKSWLAPAQQEPRAPFRVWSSDEPQPPSSIPMQVAWRLVRGEWPELDDAFHHELMRAYFEDNRNIADAETILDVATTVGADADRLRELAVEHTESVTAEVIADHNAAVQAGISSIPTVVIGDLDGNALAVPGAQPVETYERIITRLESQRSS